MLTKIKLGFGALSVVLLVGCGGGVVSNGALSAEQDLASAKEDSECRAQHPEFYTCQTDSDCVAVEKAGCCPNGYLVSVNKDQVDAYDTTYACTEDAPLCPQFVVNDQRVAQCDFTSHQCQMILPTDVRCGGFIAPAMQHQCPTGYACHYTSVPDLPGSCVESTAN